MSLYCAEIFSLVTTSKYIQVHISIKPLNLNESDANYSKCYNYFFCLVAIFINEHSSYLTLLVIWKIWYFPDQFRHMALTFCRSRVPYHILFDFQSHGPSRAQILADVTWGMGDHPFPPQGQKKTGFCIVHKFEFYCDQKIQPCVL